jgi:hypothetical protein
MSAKRFRCIECKRLAWINDDDAPHGERLACEDLEAIRMCDDCLWGIEESESVIEARIERKKGIHLSNDAIAQISIRGD